MGRQARVDVRFNVTGISADFLNRSDVLEASSAAVGVAGQVGVEYIRFISFNTSHNSSYIILSFEIFTETVTEATMVSQRLLDEATVTIRFNQEYVALPSFELINFLDTDHVGVVVLSIVPSQTPSPSPSASTPGSQKRQKKALHFLFEGWFWGIAVAVITIMSILVSMFVKIHKCYSFRKAVKMAKKKAFTPRFMHTHRDRNHDRDRDRRDRRDRHERRDRREGGDRHERRDRRKSEDKEEDAPVQRQIFVFGGNPNAPHNSAAIARALQSMSMAHIQQQSPRDSGTELEQPV